MHCLVYPPPSPYGWLIAGAFSLLALLAMAAFGFAWWITAVEATDDAHTGLGD